MYHPLTRTVSVEFTISFHTLETPLYIAISPKIVLNDSYDVQVCLTILLLFPSSCSYSGSTASLTTTVRLFHGLGSKSVEVYTFALPLNSLLTLETCTNSRQPTPHTQTWLSRHRKVSLLEILVQQELNM